MLDEICKLTEIGSDLVKELTIIINNKDFNNPNIGNLRKLLDDNSKELKQLFIKNIKILKRKEIVEKILNKK